MRQLVLMAGTLTKLMNGNRDRKVRDRVREAKK